MNLKVFAAQASDEDRDGFLNFKELIESNRLPSLLRAIGSIERRRLDSGSSSGGTGENSLVRGKGEVEKDDCKGDMDCHDAGGSCTIESSHDGKGDASSVCIGEGGMRVVGGGRVQDKDQASVKRTTSRHVSEEDYFALCQVPSDQLFHERPKAHAQVACFLDASTARQGDSGQWPSYFVCV